MDFWVLVSPTGNSRFIASGFGSNVSFHAYQTRSIAAMADDTEFSEKYIAELLKKDAQKVSASYARSGIYDALPKR